MLKSTPLLMCGNKYAFEQLKYYFNLELNQNFESFYAECIQNSMIDTIIEYIKIHQLTLEEILEVRNKINGTSTDKDGTVQFMNNLQNIIMKMSEEYVTAFPEYKKYEEFFTFSKLREVNIKKLIQLLEIQINSFQVNRKNSTDISGSIPEHSNSLTALNLAKTKDYEVLAEFDAFNNPDLKAKSPEIRQQAGESSQSITHSNIAPAIPVRDAQNKQAEVQSNPEKPAAPPLPARKVASIKVDGPQIPVPELKKSTRPPAVLPVQPQKIMKADAPKKSVPANKKEPVDKGWIMLEDSQSLGKQSLFKSNKEDTRANNRRIIIKKVLEGMEKYQSGDTTPDGVNRCESLRVLFQSEVNPHLKIMAIIAVLDGDKKEDALVSCIKDKLDRTGNKRLNYLNNQALSIAKKELEIITPEQLQNAKNAILGKIDDGTYSKMNKIEDNDVLPLEGKKHLRL